MHPFNSLREHKVQHSRVAHIAGGKASGGAVSAAAAVHAHEKHLHKGEKETRFAAGGAVGKSRLDRYARGGKVKGKAATNVNIVIAPQGGEQKPSLPPAMSAGVGVPPMPPPHPPMMPPPGGPPGMPPGMPMPHRDGGRAYAKGGAVKDGAAWKEGRRNGTQVKNTPGKNDTKDIVRPKQITFRRGGAVEASNAKGPKLTAGDNGEGRLQKAALQRRSKTP